MTRKRCNRRHYALINPITHAVEGAAVTAGPLLDKLRLVELSALEAFRAGHATRADWRALADLLNVAETMARDGIGVEVLAVCEQAQDALCRAHDRQLAGRTLALDGPGLAALRELYALHDLQRTSVSRSVYERAIERTARRIRSAAAELKVLGPAGVRA